MTEQPTLFVVMVKSRNCILLFLMDMQAARGSCGKLTLGKREKGRRQGRSFGRCTPQSRRPPFPSFRQLWSNYHSLIWVNPSPPPSDVHHSKLSPFLTFRPLLINITNVAGIQILNEFLVRKSICFNSILFCCKFFLSCTTNEEKTFFLCKSVL